MKKMQLAVAVKEQEYVKRLADYIRDSAYGSQLQLIAFTNAAACLHYLEQGYTIDLLAAQPDILSELQKRRADDAAAGELPVSAARTERVRGHAAAALVVKPGQGGGYPELLQYQSLPVLLQGLSELCARSASSRFGHSSALAGRTSAGEKSGPEVIAVYSAAGGVGKTTLALHLAHAAGAMGKRVLYLNLERWSSAAAWLEEDRPEPLPPGGEGMSELLYRLKAQPDEAGSWLSEHARRDPLLKAHYIAPCSNAEDRLQLTAEDATGLLMAIAGSGQYDLIVCDLDDGLTELQLCLLELSDHVLWLTSGSGLVQRKLSAALSCGLLKWGDRFQRVCDKGRLVCSFTDAEAASKRQDTSVIRPAGAILPEVAEWRQGGRARLNSSPLYRAATDKLLKELQAEGGACSADG